MKYGHLQHTFMSTQALLGDNFFDEDELDEQSSVAAIELFMRPHNYISKEVIEGIIIEKPDSGDVDIAY